MWKTMDTAPKDGTVVIGHSGAVGRDPFVFEMKWDAEQGWTRRVNEWYWVSVTPVCWANG